MSKQQWNSVREHAEFSGKQLVRSARGKSSGKGVMIFYCGRQWRLGYHEGMFWMREASGRKRKIFIYEDQLHGLVWEIFGGRLGGAELKWIEELATGLLQSVEGKSNNGR